MKNNGKYIVGLIILILVLVFGAGIIIVNRSSTARRIQVVYIFPKHGMMPMISGPRF